MMKYLTFFRIRFITGLQYRVAAIAGISTQFAWGFMNLLMFKAFYNSNPEAFPMKFSMLSTYIWLQQALLALFMLWFFETDIFDAISSGNIAYELVRPVDIYNMWFTKNLATRISKVVLRCFPILIVAFFLPAPMKMTLPPDFFTFLLFIFSALLSFVLVVSYCMFTYIAAFYIINSRGLRLLAMSVFEFLSGAIVPIPFFPQTMQSILYILPFASMQNTPYFIFTGFITGKDLIIKLAIQVFWVVFSVVTGKYLMKRAITKVVVQGG